jgi:hypothetical protein
MKTKPLQLEPPRSAYATASLAQPTRSPACAQVHRTGSAWHGLCERSFVNHALQDKLMDANLIVKNSPSDLILVETSDNRMLRPGVVLAQLAEFLFLQDRPPSEVKKQVGARVDFAGAQ